MAEVTPWERATPAMPMMATTVVKTFIVMLSWGVVWRVLGGLVVGSFAISQYETCSDRKSNERAAWRYR